jgi:mannose/fructose-specific phosphotransferase system component IIA
MSEPVPVRGILVAHGEMAQGMADAIHRIAGVDEEVLLPLSNDGKGPDELLRELDELAGDGPAVIFTDLFTGSCALSARKASLEDRRRVVVFGTNLPMLLDFVFHRDLPVEELVARVLARGREAVQSAPPLG